MYTIKIHFEQADKEPVIIHEAEEGSTLLELALNNGISLPHDCGGICACTTCHLYVNRGMKYITERQAREQAFIGRVAKAKPQSRLACQSVLLDGSGDLELIIPD
jgi:ferredoxin, 2Fe-2S